MLLSQVNFSLTTRPAQVYISATEPALKKVPINTNKNVIYPQTIKNCIISWEYLGTSSKITNLEEFKADFDKLVRFYTKTKNGLDLKPFAVFVEKYGPPFNLGSNSISLLKFFEILFAISTFQEWQFDKGKFARLFSKIKDIASNFQNKDICILMAHKNAASLIIDLPLFRNNFYIDGTGEFSLIYADTDNYKQNTDSFYAPKPLITIKSGEIPKNSLEWLKINLLKNLELPLQASISDLSFIFKDNSPQINFTVSSLLLMYLFEILIKKHNRCLNRNCSKIFIVNPSRREKKFCSPECRQQHFNQTNKTNRLTKLKNAWKSRGYFDEPTLNKLFVNAKEQLKTSEYETVLLWLQKQKANYQNKKEGDLRAQ